MLWKADVFLFSGLGFNKEGAMHTSDNERIALVAAKKYTFLEDSLPRYLVLSGLAGLYLGFGIALIFSLGGPLAANRGPVPG